MTALLRYWPLVVAFVGALGAGWTLAADVQAHLDADARQCEQIALIQRVLVQEYPTYSATFYYRGAPACW